MSFTEPQIMLLQYENLRESYYELWKSLFLLKEFISVNCSALILKMPPELSSQKLQYLWWNEHNPINLKCISNTCHAIKDNHILQNETEFSFQLSCSFAQKVYAYEILKRKKELNITP